MTDLAGYRIYYGTVAGNYTETIEIDSPGADELRHRQPGAGKILRGDDEYEQQGDGKPLQFGAGSGAGELTGAAWAVRR